MDKKKVLVKVHPEGKFVVDIDKNIDINDVTPNCRVALRNDSYTLHKILPNKVGTGDDGTDRVLRADSHRMGSLGSLRHASWGLVRDSYENVTGHLSCYKTWASMVR